MAHVARMKAQGEKPNWSQVEWAFMCGTRWGNSRPVCEKPDCVICAPLREARSKK